jgi:tetratricopeptide (TPR) repeat protein
MKSNKRSSGPRAQAAAVAAAPQSQKRGSAVRSGPQWWHYALGLFALLFLAFEIYQPAIRGPFLFDDRYLPFFLPGWADAPLSHWLKGVRPVLMLSYWANFQISQQDPYWYHVLNVLFHCGNAVLIWLILERVLEWAGVAAPMRRMLAIFGGLLFLVHPIQTESVAYVASRSENLSVLLFNAAFAIFAYRRSVAVSFRIAAAVLILFISACVTKEHAAALPALLLLTDYFWNPGFSFKGIARNWRLYAPMALGAVFAIWWVVRTLHGARTAGFGLKDLSWYEYFFSQCRAIWLYLLMFLVPVNQNVDHEFAVSRTIVDHGALLGMLALIAVSAAAWIWRRAYPLASYGWFVFLILLAPTSSFVPIRDLLVERRLYLPFIGLLLILCEFLRRVRWSGAALAGALGAVIVVFSFATYARNQVWGDPVALWKDTAEKSPHKSRPQFQLAYAYYSQGQCAEAASEYDKAAQLEKPDYSLYVDWALAYDCAQKPDQALDKLRQAVTLEKTAHAYALIGMVYAKQNQRPEALDALAQAERLDPRFEMTYVYRGNVYIMQNDFAKAAEQFRKALALNPADSAARNGLDMAERQVPARM